MFLCVIPLLVFFIPPLLAESVPNPVNARETTYPDHALNPFIQADIRLIAKDTSRFFHIMPPRGTTKADFKSREGGLFADEFSIELGSTSSEKPEVFG
jgi:hypothetical protein